MTAANLKHFTTTMYLVTYERGYGNYNRSYGIAGVYNTPAGAERKLQELNKKEEFAPRKTLYKIKKVNLNNVSETELFEFLY